MDRDVYDKKWKLGPFAKKKEEFKQQGKLDKYGRVVDQTPEAWKMLFGDADKATNLKEVANALGVKKADDKPKKPAVVEEESSDDEKEKKRDKKKKDKKDKKEKKEKKSKKSKKDKDSDESD